jgi:electron-transferring-flavoprotein dehydrogenase
MLKKFSRYLFSREKIQYDVLIVGAGPAGLSAAIRIKELDPNKSVIVIEKSSTLGGHILSGNCFQPKAINELFPNWQTMENVQL